MSSHQLLSIVRAPEGWTNTIYDTSAWTGKAGDLKWSLVMQYGLKDAKPIWARNVDALTIFEAKPTKEIGTFYYLWNALEFTVYRFGLKNLEELERTITKLGGGEGNLGELVLDPVKEL